jgi:hypothetical protein
MITLSTKELQFSVPSDQLLYELLNVSHHKLL